LHATNHSALCDAAESGKSVDAEGCRLTRASLHEALRGNSIERIEPNVGEKFDIATMEAMLTVPVEHDTGNVETVLRPGYMIHGERIVRAAQVGVGASTVTHAQG
jgi:molecular chaperone GrpE (heat shock protein)